MSLSQWRNFSPQDKLPATWTDGVEKLLSNYASPNFAIDQSSTTALRVKASTGDDARVLAIAGAPRYNEADASATHPGGGAGSFNLWATANANSFGTNAGPPITETDGTTYAFGLKIGTPSGSGAEAISRLLATVAWDGAKITSFASTLDPSHSSNPWLPLFERSIDLAAGTTTSQVPLTKAGGAGVLAASVPASQALYPFPVTPIGIPLLANPPQAVSLRIRLMVATNQVSPATTITVALRQATMSNGTSGNANPTSASGSDIATTSVVANAASSRFDAVSAVATPSTSAAYLALFAAPTATLAAGAVAYVSAIVEYKIA